jgi:hypothetical protein
MLSKWIYEYKRRGNRLAPPLKITIPEGYNALLFLFGNKIKR